MFWRWALQSYLNQAVRDAVKQSVASTAAESLNAADAAHHSQPASQMQCHVGIVFALKIEADGLLERLGGKVATHGRGFVVYEGALASRGIAVMICGVGQEAARRGTEALITGHRPQYVVSTGFAGGLYSHLGKYDLLMVDSIVGTDGSRLSLDLKLGSDHSAMPRGVHVGALLSTDRIIRTSQEKIALGIQHGAMAVDMESLAVANVCSREKQRFLAVRVISDTADEELPADIERLIQQKSNAGRAGAALRAVVQRPSSIKDMWNLKERAMVAADRLGVFLESVVAQLVPDSADVADAESD